MQIMKNYDDLSHEVEKRYKKRDHKKRKRMAIQGKQVFALQQMMEKTKGQRVQKLK